MTTFATETALAAHVVAWLQDQRWTVYQEVQRGYGEPVADIVAVQGPLIWIIEAKRSFTITVIEQAWRWRRQAHYISVAVPAPGMRQVRGSDFASDLLRREGIGVLRVEPHGDVREMVAPRLCRRPANVHHLRQTLAQIPEGDYAQAGSSEGGRWTPFRGTCDNLRVYVGAHPGCSLREAVCGIGTHYSSSATARANLKRWLDQGVVRGVRIEKEGKEIRLWRVEG